MSVYIKNLINQGEHQKLDFKFEISDAKKIARTLSAFSNTDGGTLLIGVKDNGAIAGVHSDEEYYMIESASQLYCKPEVPFDVKKWDMGDKSVLEIVVPKNTTATSYAKTDDGWRAFIRQADQNLMLNKIVLNSRKLKAQKKGILIKYTDKEKALLSFLERNRSITMSKFCRIAYVNKSEAETILTNMLAVELIEPHITDKGTSYGLKKDLKR